MCKNRYYLPNFTHLGFFKIMQCSGKTKVLDEEEFERTVKLEFVGQYAKRNLALLYIPYIEALRAKEIAALKIKDVSLPNLKLKRVN